MNWLRPGVWLALLVAFVVWCGVLYSRGYANGGNHVRMEWNKARADADREAGRLERERQRRADEALQLASAREARIRRDAAMARGDADGLLHDLDAVKQHAAQSGDAARVAIATLGTVFESCVREYQGLAEIADRHASDALTLEQAWPRE